MWNKPSHTDPTIMSGKKIRAGKLGGKMEISLQSVFLNEATLVQQTLTQPASGEAGGSLGGAALIPFLM